MRPCIEKLNTDSDFDVRYYASEASMGKIRAIGYYNQSVLIILIKFQRTRITTKRFSVKKKNLPAVLLITTNYKQYFSYLFECLARESNLYKFLIFSDLNPLTPKATCIDTFGLYLFSRGALNIIFHSG